MRYFEILWPRSPGIRSFSENIQARKRETSSEAGGYWLFSIILVSSFWGLWGIVTGSPVLFAVFFMLYMIDTTYQYCLYGQSG